ncbi:MAG TPA: PAS domain-containing sensor histidine kinase [Cytophagales bacterium]
MTKQGHLLHYNAAFAQLLAGDAPLPAAPDLTPFIAPADRDRVRQWLDALAPGPPALLAFSLASPGGQVHRIEWQCQAEGPGESGQGLIYLVEGRRTGPEHTPGEPAPVPPAATGEDPGISAHSLRVLLHHSADMVARFDEHLRYTYVNQALLDQTGLPVEAFLGRTTVQMAPLLGVDPAGFSRWMADLQKVLTTRAVVTHQDRLELPHQKLHFRTRMIPEGSGEHLTGILVITRIVNEVVAVQDQLSSAYATLTAIVENIPDALVAIDPDYQVVLVNSKARDSFRASVGRSVARGQNLLEILSDAPLVARQFREYWQNALAGAVYSRLHQFEAGAGTVRYYESQYSPIRDAAGHVTGALTVGRDLTEKYRQQQQLETLLENQQRLNGQLESQNKALLAQEEELAATNEELRLQREELAQTVEALEHRNFELDQLIYKTSHDIRSPLTSVLGLINVMHLEPDRAQWMGYLQHIENRVLTLDRFLQAMIHYAKVSRTALEVQRIDFAAILEATCRNLAYMNGFEQVRIELESNHAQVPFYGDRFRLEVVFANLVSNAVKYQRRNVPDRFLRISVHAAEGEVQLQFTDNGMGIHPDYQTRLFQMFYRATDQASGSGLGLYIVKQSVEKMGGTIRLESRYGEGTSIFITLPNAGT